MAMYERREAPMAATPAEVEFDRRLAELGQNRSEVVLQIGRVFLENNTLEKQTGTPYEQLMKRVEAIDKECVYLEKRKLAIKGLRRCEKCGNVLVLDSVFCNKCGEKLEPLFAEEKRAQNLCPYCGEPHAGDATFCTSCGNKLD